MKTIIYILINIFSLSYCFSQSNNLVLNHSFEEKDTCPYDASGITDLNCKYWNSPSIGTSDYFHTCGYCYNCLPEDKYILTVPNVFAGFKIPKSGYAFSGIINSDFSIIPTSREYIQGTLKDTLFRNNVYIIRYYISNTDKSFHDFCIDNIGIYFSRNSLNQTNAFRIPVIPQFNNPTGNFINNTEGWMKIEGKFTALGGEKYFSIGNFDIDANIHRQDCYGNGIPTSGGGVYMYIDDVSVIDTSLVDTIQLCINDSILLGGSYRNTEGLYIDTIQGLYVRSYLKPSTNPAYHVEIDLPFNGRDSVYVGYFWFDKNNMHTSDTTIVLNLPSITGCDSMVYFHCRNNVGIEELNAFTNGGITIYPNPSSAIIQLKISSPENDKLEDLQILIYDIRGQQVNYTSLQEEILSNKEKHYTLDIKSLSQGLYFIKIVDKENRLIANSRFVKI